MYQKRRISLVRVRKVMLIFLQWIIALLAIAGAFFIAGIGGSTASNILGYWDLPVAGFCAAIAVVLTTYFAVPSRKFVLAICAFLAGALVAWRFLEPSWYPENFGKLAYQDTHLPLIATYAGGAIGLVIVGIVSFSKRHSARP
jgi:hypothetical protein